MPLLAYFDCFAGVSGDMLLGALVDAGLGLDRLQSELDKLPLTGYELTAERRARHGLTGTKVHVRDIAQAHPARHPADIYALLEASSLSPQVKQRCRAVIARLARVEARIHGVPEDEIHFHEIGAVDTIVDVVGVVSGLEALGVQEVYASPIPLGSGTIEIAHGVMPVPAPATLQLLSEVGAPTVPHPAQTEITTPTGAALLAELARFQRPPMRVQRVGYGFGSKDFPWPNALRLWLGEPLAMPAEADEVLLLECNLDDAPGEVLAYVMERLFTAGALDVWFTPIYMKKNRPGVQLSALVAPAEVEDAVQTILRETPTLGLRVLPVRRRKARRRQREVDTPWGKVRVKEKILRDEEGREQVVARSPEYEDCARLACQHGVSLEEVYRAAAGARPSVPHTVW